MNRDRSRRLLPAAVLLLLVGVSLRLTGLSIHSFWYDEGGTMYVARSPQLIEALRGDRHPPLSFLAFRWWAELGGESDAWLRSLPALVACLSLVLFHLLARRLLEPVPATLALAVFSLSPFQIWLGQEVRMYALVELGTLVALLGVLQPARLPAAVLCVGGTCLAQGSHYMGGLALPAGLGLAAWLSWCRSIEPRGLRDRALALTLGNGLWIPWFVTVMPDQLQTRWGFQLRAGPRDLLELPVRQVLVELDVLVPALTALGLATGIAILVAVIIALVAGLRNPRQGVAAAGVLFAVPVGVALAAMLVLPPNLTPKYLVVSSPAVALLVAGGVSLGRPRWVSWLLGAAVFLGCLTLTVLHRQGNHREDFRAACADLRAAWSAGDQLVVITGTPAGFSEATVLHYLRDSEELVRSVRSWEAFVREARDERGDQRLHVVYRSARYAEAQLRRASRDRDLIEKSPERFRIQWLLFGPESVGSATPPP